MSKQVSTKQVLKTVLEIASAIGSLYGFWKNHESEIKSFVQPFTSHCFEASKSFAKNGDNNI